MRQMKGVSSALGLNGVVECRNIAASCERTRGWGQVVALSLARAHCLRCNLTVSAIVSGVVWKRNIS